MEKRSINQDKQQEVRKLFHKMEYCDGGINKRPHKKRVMLLPTGNDGNSGGKVAVKSKMFGRSVGTCTLFAAQ